MSTFRRLLAAIPFAALAACGGDSDVGRDDLEIVTLYDHDSAHLVLQLSRPLGSDEHVRVGTRRGKRGALDCATASAHLSEVTGSGDRLDGPAVDPALLQPFYGPEWAHGTPTPEMLAAVAKGTDSLIDVCVVAGTTVVAQSESDLFEASDRGQGLRVTFKADHAATGETRIDSAQKYGERCVGELGEIPFFQKTAEGSYTTYNCLDSTPIPMTVTDDQGRVTMPEGTVSKCDKPQYIYSLCEQGPRVATRVNEQGTRWTMLCRKSIGGLSSSEYNDIAMIGHNPFTGKTCYFQNALYQKTDGAHIPHPADVQKSANLWSGVHGGLGSGIQCSNCHDSDAFIHSPWIDGAKDSAGRPVVPKFGIDQDMPLGANDSPYSIVNLAGQGWTMHKQLVSPAANACLSCHRMGAGMWTTWAGRLDGTDASFKNITTTAYQAFDKIHWMPPELNGLNESNWSSSAFATAIDLLKRCASDRNQCQWADIPTSATPNDPGESKLYTPSALPDDQLAKKAADLLGVSTPGASSRCGECHSLTRRGLREWLSLTTTALEGCLKETIPGETHHEDVPQRTVTKNQFIVFGPYTVPVGGKFTVKMAGTGDADLYVKKDVKVTKSTYDCRPYANGSNETCGPTAGPGQFWVGVNGYATTSKITLSIDYSTAGTTRPPLELVNCLRMDPSRSDSPFTPAHAGVFAAGAHLGWAQNVFHAAFPTTTPGNTENTWITEYLKYRQRVGMPKGNHPRFTQGELDIVATWFAKGLPRLEDVVADDPPPTTCTPSLGNDLLDHVNQMKVSGWSAVNRERGLNMFGCAGAADPRQCLSTLPAASSKPYGAGWVFLPGSQLRILRELSFITSYWMRSSADGRFIANGARGGTGAMTSDLQANKDIPTHAAYDPGFFPDNSGFVFQGTPVGTGMCNYDLLTSNPREITFGEAQCGAATQIGLYQHLGAGLGGDYFAINGQFTSDDGGHQSTLEDPTCGFTSSTEVTITPMTHTGNHYEGKPPVALPMPFEGDSVLSPSTRLMINRLSGPDAKQLGYVVHKVNATPTSTGYAITAPEIARLCVRGGKPAVSFDERFMAFHHYVEADDWRELGFASATDPKFVEYRQKGASNIYVLDLTTGVSKRVTTMNPGQHALFPHFRSDGWIYFLVRDAVANKEYAVASDAALVLR